MQVRSQPAQSRQILDGFAPCVGFGLVGVPFLNPVIVRVPAYIMEVDKSTIFIKVPHTLI